MYLFIYFSLSALLLTSALPQDVSQQYQQQQYQPQQYQPQQYQPQQYQPEQTSSQQPGQKQTQSSQPQQQNNDTILKDDVEVGVDGYNFQFETSNGISRLETGEYKNDTEQQGLLVRGQYSYTAPDGSLIEASFIADKDGYRLLNSTSSATGQV